jgi:hypothetical protein
MSYGCGGCIGWRRRFLVGMRHGGSRGSLRQMPRHGAVRNRVSLSRRCERTHLIRIRQLGVRVLGASCGKSVVAMDILSTEQCPEPDPLIRPSFAGRSSDWRTPVELPHAKDDDSDPLKTLFCGWFAQADLHAISTLSHLPGRSQSGFCARVFRLLC